MSRNFIKQLSVSLISPSAIDLPILSVEKRAAVALVLRFAPGPKKPSLASPSSSSSSSSNLESFLQGIDNSAEIEALYIKRAIRKGDRWSGHIGLPGGNATKDEKEMDCATRETLEEIGVDLTDSSRFICLGALKVQFSAQLFNRFVVRPIVFLQISNEEIDFKLNPKEVAAAFWIPLRYFEGPETTTVDVTIMYPMWHQWFVDFCNARGHFMFNYNGVVLKPKREVRSPGAVIDGFVLWGMTLDMTYSCFRAGKYPNMAAFDKLMSLENDPPYRLLQEIRKTEFPDLALPARPLTPLSPEKEIAINYATLQNINEAFAASKPIASTESESDSADLSLPRLSALDRSDALGKLNYILALTETRHRARL